MTVVKSMVDGMPDKIGREHRIFLNDLQLRYFTLNSFRYMKPYSLSHDGRRG